MLQNIAPVASERTLNSSLRPFEKLGEVKLESLGGGNERSHCNVRSPTFDSLDALGIERRLLGKLLLCKPAFEAQLTDSQAKSLEGGCERP